MNDKLLFRKLKKTDWDKVSQIYEKYLCDL